MKYLIIGLGNPGTEYLETRHNIGFKILDRLADKYNTKFIVDRHVFYSEIKYRSRKLILIKPTTYMNLSGKAVNFWTNKLKIPISKILVVTDDIALPTGVLRIKPKGSDGGHNGLKNINESLSRSDYPRLRFVIGNEYSKGGQSNHVLGNFNEKEIDKISHSIDLSIDIIQAFTTLGIDKTMNLYNRKQQ